MNIYVGNLSWSMTNDDLLSLFEQFGEVSSAKIITDKFSGRSKGFGFVEMGNTDEAQAAISSLHDSEIQGRKLVVNEAQPRQDEGYKKRNFGGGGGFRKGGGGGYRGGSGGGYRSGGYNKDRDY